MSYEIRVRWTRVRRNAALTLVSLVGLSLILAGVVWAQPPTQISSCPYTISVPGQYVVTEDLVSTGPGACISIEVSHVDLRLSGHSITGPGGQPTDNSQGVFVNGDTAAARTDVRIQGPGVVQNFQSGVKFAGTGDSTVMNVTVANNTVEGIRFFGFSDKPADNNRVIQNAAIGNGNEGIILEPFANDNHVIGNKANGNGFLGIGVEAGRNTLHANEANQNKSWGIAVFPGRSPGTNGNSVAGNTSNGNQQGIVVFPGATGNSFDGNTALGNSFLDLFDGNPNCDANRWRGNRFNTSNQSCIR